MTDLAAKARRVRWVKAQKAKGCCIVCGKPGRTRKDGRPAVFCLNHYDLHQQRNARTQKARDERYKAKKAEATAAAQQDAEARAALEDLQQRMR